MAMKRQLAIYKPALSFVCCLMAVMLLAACSGGSGSSDNSTTGTISFQVQWDRSAVTQNDSIGKSVTDCADVNTVSAAIYDADGRLLQTGGPWNCLGGQGTVSGVPAERYVQIAVVGLTAGGLARYRGQSSGTIYLPAGGAVDAGLITAPAFTVTLTSPADGALVNPSSLTLAWNAVSGAESYVVEIANDISFDAASILQTLTVDASANPSCQPDTSGLIEDMLYYWRVQVVDGAGNTSEPSGYRQFAIFINQLPTAQMIVPGVGYVHYSGSSLTCQGSATDPEDGNLTGAALQWELFDPSGTLVWTGSGETPLIDYTYFSILGPYTITLEVTDSNGGTDLVTRTFNVVAG